MQNCEILANSNIHRFNLVIASKMPCLLVLHVVNHICVILGSSKGNSRLLDILRLRTRLYPSRYRVEASAKQTKEISAQSAAIDGCVVSIPIHDSNWMLIKIVNSAGISAAVKTSKIPITVNAQPDITCGSRARN